MNQSQRKFLIDRIMSKAKDQKKALEDQKRELPNAGNYIFRSIMAGELKLRSEEEILEVLKQKALAAKEGQDWLVGESNRYSTRSASPSRAKVSFTIDEIMIVPQKYYDIRQEVLDHNARIEEQIRNIDIQTETLEVRIQLASPKTLQKMISEVDDMGQLSLIDAKVKLISE